MYTINATDRQGKTDHGIEMLPFGKASTRAEALVASGIYKDVEIIPHPKPFGMNTEGFKPFDGDDILFEDNLPERLVG